MATSSISFQGISVIIPCLNEEASIGLVIDRARRGIAKLAPPNGGQGLQEDILVVDNGSTDRSAQVAREHGARVLTEHHQGYGSALRKGFNNARYEIMVMGDGDLTYDFESLDILVRPILDGQADFVMGNRMKSIQPGAMPKLHRYVGNPLLSFALRTMFRTRSVHDAHCGMRAITRTAYRKLHCVTTGMEFASEMVVRAIRCRLRIAERDIVYHPRVGRSKLHSFRDGWRHLRFMILHSPTFLVLVPGTVFWVLGLAMTLPLAFGPIVIHYRVVDIHCMLIGGVLNIVSIQIITIGLLAKAYGHLSGLHADPVMAWFYRWFTFEKACIVSGLVVLVGLIITLKVMIEWIASGFGALNQQRLLFFAVLCLVNGVQLGAASFLFSIMALPRHLDHLPPEARDTGITDT
ncbi:MAG: glycosyltransferase family 2 protein [Verrucomicrobia bacterium]|nr:glycosyltransferase family 2 protein [Verrucomicrobiota bacterium]MBU4291023.1 glycosyltransferase family 2 protein [Verrucomicrobiota bacterium]MBU4429894.1 glycosyltransferase family 2 protein [Verrucomicrobiota bacterium]MCG2678913.1 glycosyltransferase family 2 protein [Kiritimatiellia bacterium]